MKKHDIKEILMNILNKNTLDVLIIRCFNKQLNLIKKSLNLIKLVKKLLIFFV